MKKIFEMMGILTLVIFSFFVRDKTVSVMKDSDEIMINIKQNYQKYNQKSENAIVSKNTIIPGIKGRKVNINKSYQKMREYGKYNDQLYVYDYNNPKISIDNNKDKVIINGNKKYRQVSIIVLLNDDSNIDNLIKIANDNDIKLNFFVTDDWLLTNNTFSLKIIKEGHTIGINNKMDYQSSEVKWMDTIIKRVGKQKHNYCLYKKESNCFHLNNYTIKPIIINNNYLLNVQDKISNGNMFLFNNTNTFNEELISIIRYINTKGYDIVSLNKLISEQPL